MMNEYATDETCKTCQWRAGNGLLGGNPPRTNCHYCTRGSFVQDLYSEGI